MKTNGIRGKEEDIQDRPFHLRCLATNMVAIKEDKRGNPYLQRPNHNRTPGAGGEGEEDVGICREGQEMKCSWCGQEHGNFWGPTRYLAETSRNIGLIKTLKKHNLIHAYIGSTPKTCYCGIDTQVFILPIPGPAHPATPVIAHKGTGCIATWLHSEELMKSEGLEPKPLPCDDKFCNLIWEIGRVKK